MEQFDDDNLSTPEKMLIYLIRKNDVPVEPLFSFLYEKFEVAE